jgi:hypothetical protein
MIELLSEKPLAGLLSLPSKKKAAFMLLLYQRMVPELRSFVLTRHQKFSYFQEASERFWSWLRDDSVCPWLELRETLLSELPDTEQLGTREAYFALNCGLVAAELAGFLADGRDSHIIDAIGYAGDSLDAHATPETELSIYDEHLEERIEKDSLVEIERKAEEGDVVLLTTLPDPPWTANVLSVLQQRALAQTSMLGG